MFLLYDVVGICKYVACVEIVDTHCPIIDTHVNFRYHRLPFCCCFHFLFLFRNFHIFRFVSNFCYGPQFTVPTFHIVRFAPCISFILEFLSILFSSQLLHHFHSLMEKLNATLHFLHVI